MISLSKLMVQWQGICQSLKCIIQNVLVILVAQNFCVMEIIISVFLVSYQLLMITHLQHRLILLPLTQTHIFMEAKYAKSHWFIIVYVVYCICSISAQYGFHEMKTLFACIETGMVGWLIYQMRTSLIV